MQNAKFCTNLISIFDVFSPKNTNFFLPFEILTNKGRVFVNSVHASTTLTIHLHPSQFNLLTKDYAITCEYKTK